MPSDTQTRHAVELRRLRHLVTELASACDWTPTQLARAANLAPSTLNRFLGSDVPHLLSTRTVQSVIQAANARLAEMSKADSGAQGAKQRSAARLEKVARALTVYAPMASISSEASSTVDLIGAAQADVWKDSAFEMSEEPVSYDFPEDRRYKYMERVAFILNGDSMDLVYPPHTLLVAIRLEDIGRAPQHGERVIVRQDRDDGKVEVTVREYVVDDQGGVLLFFRSSNPKYAMPVRLDAGGGDRPTKLSIVAIVIGAYRPE
ncbi:MAG: hypothetical protein AB7P02_23945 [Alphaproteobacteria bacterium]